MVNTKSNMAPKQRTKKVSTKTKPDITIEAIHVSANNAESVTTPNTNLESIEDEFKKELDFAFSDDGESSDTEEDVHVNSLGNTKLSNIIPRTSALEKLKFLNIAITTSGHTMTENMSESHDDQKDANNASNDCNQKTEEEGKVEENPDDQSPPKKPEMTWRQLSLLSCLTTGLALPRRVLATLPKHTQVWQLLWKLLCKLLQNLMWNLL